MSRITFLNRLLFKAFLALFLAHVSHAQNRAGDYPFSFGEQLKGTFFHTVRPVPPDVEALYEEDTDDDGPGVAARIAALLPVELSTENSGTWSHIKGQGYVWRLGIHLHGARALGLYYSSFSIPQGATLYVFDNDHRQLSNPYNSAHNTDGGAFATHHIYGDHLVLEYFQPYNVTERPDIRISEVAFFYRGIGAGYQQRGFGDAGFCEVNINCSPEGDDWQDTKRGVVRIKCRVGGSAFWCTGTLINNTRQDKTPYILTADHCAYKFLKYATPQDLEQWMFYFDFEAAGCENPLQAPQEKSMTGAIKIASGGNHGTEGSDFYLVKLIDSIPPGYHVWFNGWNALDIAANEGVTIHHPEGDIKKVSVFGNILQTVAWSGNGLPSHWKVVWSETENGHGVTEPGSSGSPLFDNAGRIVGTLTGGQASCNQPTLPDYYGKFSYHWVSNGDDDTLQLKPWLDPDNTGILSLDGTALIVEDTAHEPVIRVQCYPNPARSNIFLTHAGTHPVSWQIDILDLHGRQIASFNRITIESGGQTELDVSFIIKGVYLLRLIDENNVFLHKIILQ